MTAVCMEASACYLPDNILSNDELIKHCGLDIDDAWIRSRTGIESRHWLREGQTTSDMVVEVAQALLAQAQLQVSDIDRIVLATVSGDYPSPSTAALVARKLGACCSAFDISAACTGFIYALDVGMGAIATGDKHVLVIAADARSRFIDKSDRRGAVLFADGAGGMLLGRGSGEQGFRSVFTCADGRYDTFGAWVPAGGSVQPTSLETVQAGQHYLQVDGLKEIFALFVDYTRLATDAALQKAGMQWSDIDVYIPHQGNAYLVDHIIRALDFPADKTINDVARHGNTTSASIPIAFAEARAAGRIKPGDRVMMSAVGAGITYGAAIYQC